MPAMIMKALAYSLFIALTVYERIVFGESSAWLVLGSPVVFIALVITLGDIKKYLKLRYERIYY